jgi:precorrin-6A/cobalt-precorrin-6A reductase
MKIWLIGGTSDSRAIAQQLTAWQIPWFATVVTERARQLYAGLPGAVQVTTLNPQTITPFLQQAEHPIQGIIDASHPFAVEISHLAMQTRLPYLRFERPDTPLVPPAIALPTWDAILQPEYLQGKRVLLTIGVKALPLFVPWLHRGEFWARILPTDASRQSAIQAGFPGDRLIPLTLPMQVETETQLWQSLQVDIVVTKASGDAGGFAVKMQVAQALQIPLLVLTRPPLTYPRHTHEIAVIESFCRELGFNPRSPQRMEA